MGTRSGSSTLIEITARNRSSHAVRGIYFDQCLNFPFVFVEEFPRGSRCFGVIGEWLLSY